jgi:hypothetical protein
MAENEKSGRKNSVWTYNFNTHNLSVTFPNDRRENFDLTTLVSGMNQQQEIIYQYGVKQLFASNWAAEKTIDDKVTSAMADYDDLCAGHAVLFGEGKIGFGRTRVNAGKSNFVKTVENKFTTMTLAECESLLVVADAGIAPISQELREKIEARIQELKQ